MGSEQLFFQAADGHHAATQSDLARHRDVAPHGHLDERRRQRRGHRHAGGRSVFADELREVNVHVDFCVELRIQPEDRRARADVAHRGLGALFHALLEETRDDELALAGNDGDLAGEQFPLPRRRHR